MSVAAFPFHARFPNLAGDGLEQTSPEDELYNCIAFAADDTNNWWWPTDYWPLGAPRLLTLAAFVAAYEMVGYAVCADGTFAATHEKVVIYCDAVGVPTHAARQLDSGHWTSKLGGFWDVRHATPRGVEGPAYGTAVQFLSRPIVSPDRVLLRSARVVAPRVEPTDT